MTSNVFDIQDVMLEISQDVINSSNQEHIAYGKSMLEIFSRKHSHEESNGDEIPIIPIAKSYIGQKSKVKKFLRKHPKCLFHAVRFPISRYAMHQQTLVFSFGVSVVEAMKKVNMYLGQPVTCDYFNRVRTEQPTMFVENMDISQMNRWNIIQGAIFLDGFDIERLGSGKMSRSKKVLVLQTGS
jgi:hypothetical protein